MEPIQANEHCFFGGMTGSGKTTLAKRYLLGFKNVVIIDPKWTFKWPEAQIQDGRPVPIFHDPGTMMRKLASGRAIYRPNKDGLKLEALEELYGWGLERGETVLYTDEQYAVTPNGRIVENQKAILTRGREVGVANWSASQRPSWIPLFCMSEAMHIFSFRLRLPKDRKTMAGIMGESLMKNPTGKHGFYYSHETWEDPILLPEGINA